MKFLCFKVLLCHHFPCVLDSLFSCQFIFFFLKNYFLFKCKCGVTELELTDCSWPSQIAGLLNPISAASQVLGLQMVATPAQPSHGCWGFEHWSSSMCIKLVIHWAISSYPLASLSASFAKYQCILTVPALWKLSAGGSLASLGQLGLHNKTLSQNNNNKWIVWSNHFYL